MKRPLSSRVSTAIILLSLVIAPALPSNASLPPDPTVLTMPAFTISSAGQLTISPVGAWEQGSTTTYSVIVDQAYACSGAGSAVSRQFASNNRGQVLNNESCSPLWANAGSTTPFSGGNLSAAFLNGFPYAGSPANIRIATIAVLTNGQFFWAATASQNYTPPPAGPQAPTWSGAQAPVASITGTTLTGTIPALTSNAQYSDHQERAWVCNTSLAAGFASWSYGNGQNQILPSTSFPASGVDCRQFMNFTGANPFNLSDASVANAGGTSTPYSPFTHGVHLLVGRTVLDNAGTPGTGANASDDVYWMAHSASVVFTPPTISTQPALVLTGTSVTATAGTWNLGTAIDYLVACDSPRTVPVTVAVASSTLTSGCRPLYASSNSSSLAMATDLASAFVPSGSSRQPFDAATHGRNLGILSINLGGAVATVTVELGSASTPEVATTPYTGPILQTPGAVAPVAQGSKVVIPGSNLSGVSKVEIGGVDAKVVVNSAGELEITVPTGLTAGTYDLVVTSDSGKLTVQGAIRVSGSAVVSETTESTARPSTKLKEDNTVKVHVFDVVGAGKVQIMFNGKEIAWVNTTDPNDSKLLNEYLVRTLELVDGKNVIEIFVDGKRVDRKAYTKVDDSSDRI